MQVDQAARLKAEKVRIALEKIKEANIKKVHFYYSLNTIHSTIFDNLFSSIQHFQYHSYVKKKRTTINKHFWNHLLVAKVTYISLLSFIACQFVHVQRHKSNITPTFNFYRHHNTTTQGNLKLANLTCSTPIWKFCVCVRGEGWGSWSWVSMYKD